MKFVTEEIKKLGNNFGVSCFSMLSGRFVGTFAILTPKLLNKKWVFWHQVLNKIFYFYDFI